MHQADVGTLDTDMPLCYLAYDLNGMIIMFSGHNYSDVNIQNIVLTICFFLSSVLLTCQVN